MKRCNECNKLADNGDKRCQYCGAPFEYDPWVNPFSETRIFLGLLAISLLVLIVYNAIPLKLPDPTECSQTSVKRFRKIAEQYYQESKNVLRAEIISTTELSELMAYKNEAEEIPVHPCLAPAKTYLVDYLNEVYYMTLYSSWGSFQASTSSMNEAAHIWDILNAELDRVEVCAPNCP